MSEIKGYKVAMRVQWQTKSDTIELRILTGSRPLASATRQEWVTIHLGLNQELVGISVMDNKQLRLGLWLRQNWPEWPLEPLAADAPPPIYSAPGLFNRVVYDENGQIAFFGVMASRPDGDPDVTTVQRRADLLRDADGQLCVLRLPVQSRRTRAGDLSIAAGYLAVG